MFTRVVDDAVARYVLADGTEVAFAHDFDSANPVVEFDYPIGIERMERGSIAADPVGLLARYDRLNEAAEEGGHLLGELGMTLDEALEQEDLDPVDTVSLREYENAQAQLERLTYMEWTDTNEYGHPTYRIVYDREMMDHEGWNVDRLDSIVKEMAREYSAWTCGSLYVMGVEDPENGPVYMGVPADMDPDDMDDVAELLEDRGYNTNGMERD